MAKSKSTEVTEVHKPDLKKMKSIFLRDLMPAGEKAAKIRGDQSAAWKTIEADCHCNKRAAKQLLKLLGESEETREDYLRTLIPGLKVLNLLPEDDLVDLMDGESEPDVSAISSTRALGTEGMPALQ